MNIAISRAFGALRVVVPRRELEKEESVYLLTLCGLPWCAVIIIKSDDYCA